MDLGSMCSAEKTESEGVRRDKEMFPTKIQSLEGFCHPGATLTESAGLPRDKLERVF